MNLIRTTLQNLQEIFRDPKLLWAGVISSLAASLILQLALALVPFLLTAVYALFEEVSTPVVFLAAAWSLTGVIGAFWFRGHTRRRIERTKELVSNIFIADRSLNTLITEQLGTLQKPDIEKRIHMLLLCMCDILVPRVDSQLKGASFLILSDDTEDAHFEVFTHVRHNHEAIAIEVRENLTKNEGLAAQALRESKLLVLHDSRRITPGLDWIDTHTHQISGRLEYIGRAIAPVQAIVGNEPKDIGVLCFDIRMPLTLNYEDRTIIGMIADKIASIWILYQPSA